MSADTGSEGASMITGRTETPSLGLRFVERATSINGEIRMLRILQQGWHLAIYRDGEIVDRKLEWRDVPVETES